MLSSKLEPRLLTPSLMFFYKRETFEMLFENQKWRFRAKQSSFAFFKNQTLMTTDFALVRIILGKKIDLFGSNSTEPTLPKSNRETKKKL